MSGKCTSGSLVAIPLYNEVEHIEGVISAIRKYYGGDILVVNDGSTDGSGETLKKLAGIEVITHETNIGYGRSLIDAFSYAIRKDYGCLVTIDCDEQHEPRHIPHIFENIGETDVYSASRYLKDFDKNDQPPGDRYRINMTITRNINMITGYGLTDGFCGMKGYKVKALEGMDLVEPGYAFPIEFWLQAYKKGLTVREFPIERIYKNLNRTFGSGLDDPASRLKFYFEVMERELKRWQISSPSGLIRTI